MSPRSPLAHARVRLPHAVSALRLVLAVLATALALAWPALLLNGAPLIFSDTLDFFAMGLGPDRYIRPWGYGWFAGPLARACGSLWLVVAAQALLTAALAHAVLRTVLPELDTRRHTAAGLGLAALTSAPWAASYVMPDALTAPGLLALFLVLVLPGNRWSAVLIAAAVVALATASHVTHLMTALAILGAFGLGRLVAGTALAVPARRLGFALAAALLGAGATVGANAALKGRAEYAGGGSIFLAARLAGDGLLQRYLAAACPDPSLPRTCAARARIPQDADEFLWSPNSLLYDNGGDFLTLEPEMAAAVEGTLRTYWPAWVASGLGRGLRQFMTLDAGDGLDRKLVIALAPWLADEVSPAAAAIALGSRQAREELGDHPLAAVPGPLALAALTTCVVLAVGWRRRLAHECPQARLLLALVLIGGLANAGAVGLGAAVHARYQSRMAWLFPFAACTALASLRNGRPVSPALPAPTAPWPMRPPAPRPSWNVQRRTLPAGPSSDRGT